MNKNKIKDVLVFIVGLISLIYLLNPGLGFLEFLPDNFPFLGNLDEGTATFLLFSSLAYFGVDLRQVFGNFFKREAPKIEK